MKRNHVGLTAALLIAGSFLVAGAAYAQDRQEPGQGPGKGGLFPPPPNLSGSADESGTGNLPPGLGGSGGPIFSGSAPIDSGSGGPLGAGPGGGPGFGLGVPEAQVAPATGVV